MFACQLARCLPKVNFRGGDGYPKDDASNEMLLTRRSWKKRILRFRDYFALSHHKKAYDPNLTSIFINLPPQYPPVSHEGPSLSNVDADFGPV